MCGPGQHDGEACKYTRAFLDHRPQFPATWLTPVKRTPVLQLNRLIWLEHTVYAYLLSISLDILRRYISFVDVELGISYIYIKKIEIRIFSL